MGKLKPFSPSLPSLSADLNSLYHSLDSINQSIFIKVFKYLWGVVLPAHRFNGRGASLYGCWALDCVVHASGLGPSYFSLLLFIYHITGRGTKYIHSTKVYNSRVLLPGVSRRSLPVYICTLVKLGYLSRSFKDPDNPYYKISFSSRPVFIKVTVKGLQYIAGIEKDLYKLLLNTSLDDLTGNKKAR